MTDYNDGKIYGWNGGECPVHPESVVTTWYRRGGSEEGIRAGQIWWDQRDDFGDIVCFQVTKPYAKPKTIWVNEWSDGRPASYHSEEEAKQWSNKHHTRIAVEYVEKQK